MISSHEHNRINNRGYMLILLTAILIFNYVDRVAFGIVLEDIKVDLSLSDTELGLMGGIAFALFYSVLGIPIARLADRGNRILIISVTAIVWSVAVALCGAAQSFAQLILIRIAVAIGEAGAFAPAVSLISDAYGRAERPRALAVFNLAWPLSCVVGYFLAGWLNQVYGWRAVFFLLGIPGILLAVQAFLTLREPRKADFPSSTSSTTGTQMSLLECFSVLWRCKTYRHLLCAISTLYFFSYGILQWHPAFFVRSFGMDSGAIGVSFAVVYGIGGLLGTYLGGWWSTRCSRENETRQLNAVAYAIVASAFSSILLYSTSERSAAFAFMGITVALQAAISGPLFATLQSAVPESLRATSIAILLLLANLIGMGFGPLVAGMLSDYFSAAWGAESLRHALLVLAPGYFLVSIFVWLARKSVKADLLTAAGANTVAHVTS